MTIFYAIILTLIIIPFALFIMAILGQIMCLVIDWLFKQLPED